MTVEGPALEPPALTAYDKIVAKTQKQHRLFSAHWELTYRCNQRCTHCYLDVLAPAAPAPAELTTAECLRVMDELAAMGVLNLTLSGGEIFVRRDLFEIAEYARGKQFLLRLFTNGIAITPTIADRIAALHPYAVEMSVYGAQPETHEIITCVPRSFELTMRAFRLLRERGVRTAMKTPLMRENVREFHALEALAAELGAMFRYDITISPKDTGGRAPLQHRLTDDDLLWLFRETMDPRLWVNRAPALDQPTCNMAGNALVIDPYGDIFACIQGRRAIGNVRTLPLRTIWEESPVWQELRQLTLGALPVCGTCELRAFCVRCHGLALIEDGDLRGPCSVNCRDARLRRQVLVEKGLLPSDRAAPERVTLEVGD
ncbi:MAG: radical SAM protein [Chloroflexi bacterium]|nr:radical SAM protein [Chloroflexota bacterium]